MKIIKGRQMRQVVSGVLGVIILLIIAWVGIWFYAEMRVKQMLVAGIERIDSTGVEKVTYEKLVTGNSPLTASVAFLQPNLSARLDPSSPVVTISAARFGAHVNLLHPLTLVFDIPLSTSINTGGVSEVLTFQSVKLVCHLSPGIWLGNAKNPILGVDADLTGINLLASNGSLQVLQVDRITTHETLNIQANSSQTAMAFTSDIQNLRLSSILTRLFNIPFNGTINRLSTALTLSGPLNWEQLTAQNEAPQTNQQRADATLQTLHSWAEANGHAQGSLNLRLGPSNIQTSFTLGFDQQAQPNGTADIFADHLGQFFNQVVTSYPEAQGWVGQITTVLGPYLSNTAQAGQVLNMHTLYGQNGVFINGQKMGDMPELDWNNLLNRLSLPDLAPGDGSGAMSQ